MTIFNLFSDYFDPNNIGRIKITKLPFAAFLFPTNSRIQKKSSMCSKISIFGLPRHPLMFCVARFCFAFEDHMVIKPN